MISPLLTTIESAVADVDPTPIFDGVSQISAVGAPGPLMALNVEVVPIVAGDEDTEPAISTVAMASSLGSGRVVALGHDGFLINEAIVLYDNKKFGDNIIAWLDKQNLKTILLTTGHSEWQGGANSDSFKLELEPKGYTVTRYSGSISSSALSGISVVIVGNAWGAITQQEILALQNFVSGGGGLLLMGLGWSWEPYNQGSTLDDYPMNQLGEVFGIRWIDGYISDPTNNYQGQPIFHTFYPNIEIQTIYQAFNSITTITEEYPSDLPEILQTDSTIRSRYVKANMFLAALTMDLSTSSTQLDEIYTFYRDLVNSYPQYYQKSVVYDIDSQSTIAWVRERIYRNMLNALLNGDRLTSDKKAEIASTLGLTGKYAEIWDDYSVLLLDGSRLDETQKSVISDYLSKVPTALHNLRSISVVDYLGTLPIPTPGINLWGLEGGVNIFGFPVGEWSENGFPDDVAPKYSDVFTLVLAHEVNHVIDAFFYDHNRSLRERKDALVARAGADHMNYLRSMFDDGFFFENPQEFFASIANQWFSDSALTLELALARFDVGYREPLNQFLFFADVYSRKGDFTQFYTLDTQGNIQKHSGSVLRDKAGHISGIAYGSTLYKFTLDQNGYVLSYLTTTVEELTVASPNGGEEWVSGTVHSITWASTGCPLAKVKIELVKPGVANKVIVSSAVNDGSFDWTIPLTQALGSDYSVKVTRTTFPTGSTPATDTSDTYFSLIPEELTVTSTNGGEEWVSGTVNQITWTSTGNPLAKVKIELVKPGVANKVISSSTPNDGSFDWTIPLTQALGSDYSVKITRTTKPAGGSAATDYSDAAFAIIR